MLDWLVARAATIVTHTEPPRIFTEFGRHPRLFRAWLPFAGTLLLGGDLPRADAEVLILRTAWNCNSRYEWVHHAVLGQRAGLRTAQIAAIAKGPTAHGLSRRQRLLVQAADDLHADRTLRSPTLAALGDVFTDRQRIELCVLVGHYEMLAMVLNSRAVEPEPAARDHLHGRVASLADELAPAGTERVLASVASRGD